MKQNPILPKPGDVVGFVCGPGEFPRKGMCATGIVLCITSDQWYSHIATVLMDDGSVQNIIGAYTERGIGSYLIKRQEVAA